MRGNKNVTHFHIYTKNATLDVGQRYKHMYFHSYEGTKQLELVHYIYFKFIVLLLVISCLHKTGSYDLFATAIQV